MEFSQVQELVHATLLAHIQRPLTEAELAILQGAWQNQTYEAVAESCGYSLNYLQRTAAPKFWKLLSQIFQHQFNKANARAILIQLVQQLPAQPTALPGQANPQETVTSKPIAQSMANSTTIDWGEAPDVSSFYGRSSELNTLQTWVHTEQCRLIALLGMGGIGKSSLAAKVVQTLQDQFQFVIWRSLRNAPPLETLLADIVSFLSDQQDTQAKPERLLHWLRQSRCLLIFDNLETIMQSGARAGVYQRDYQAYGELLQLVAETPHSSCLLLTSREKPAEFGILEGDAVRSLALTGCPEASLALLETKHLVGSPLEKQQLCEAYHANPLALKITAALIQNSFAGEIAAFLAEETMIFSGLRRLLEQQFQRLSTHEKTVMYWLAINREWTSMAELSQDIVPNLPRTALLETLDSLAKRSLIEVKTGRFTQQPVVMEYMTERMIDAAVVELEATELNFLANYGLSQMLHLPVGEFRGKGLMEILKPNWLAI
jgi:NACHT domain